MAVQRQGAYLLYFEIPGELWIQRPQESRLQGPLVYVGSAMGSQGFQRVVRHLRYSQKVGTAFRTFHWHIDQILRALFLSRIYLVPSDKRLECSVAQILQQHFPIAVPNFGSSDCACPSHLFQAPWFDLEKVLKDHELSFLRLCVSQETLDPEGLLDLEPSRRSAS